MSCGTKQNYPGRQVTNCDCIWMQHNLTARVSTVKEQLCVLIWFGKLTWPKSKSDLLNWKIPLRLHSYYIVELISTIDYFNQRLFWMTQSLVTVCVWFWTLTMHSLKWTNTSPPHRLQRRLPRPMETAQSHWQTLGKNLRATVNNCIWGCDVCCKSV